MKLFRRSLALTLSFLLFFSSVAQVQAGMIGNNQLMQSVQHDTARSALLQTMQREDVQQQLATMGVSPADIENRVNSMTPDEIAQLNQQIEELPAGAGALGVLLVVFVVFVITDVIGATDIFPFIHPVR